MKLKASRGTRLDDPVFMLENAQDTYGPAVERAEARSSAWMRGAPA